MEVARVDLAVDRCAGDADEAVGLGAIEDERTGDVARFEAGADGVLRREMRPAPSNGAPAVAASPRG